MRRVLEAVGEACTTPGVVAHELTHVLLSWPYFDVETVRLRWPAPAVTGAWRPETPGYAVLLGKLGPTLVGVAAAVLAAAHGLLSVPTSGAEGLAAAVLVANWVAYTTPSRDDLRFPRGDTTT